MRHAAPYIHAFRGKTFVLAFGGEVMQSQAAIALAHDCNLLEALGIRLVLVHGARPQIEAELARRGLTPRYHHGRRVTDAEALECVKAAMCVTRLEIEALLSQGLPHTPMAGAYMRVTGGNFITAKPVGVVDGVDYQHTGTVRKIIAGEIAADLDQQNVVLISPIGTSPSGEIFNLSMEEVAQAVAVALKADKLIYLTDAPGITDDAGGVIHALTTDEAEKLLAERHDFTEDQALYLPCAVAAVRGGVGRAHLIGRNHDGGLLLEFFTRQGVGTLVTRDPLARLRPATIEDVATLVSIIAPLEADGTLVRRGRELLESEAERFILLEHDGMAVGCAALYPFSHEQAAELACLAVRSEYRRAGYGEMLLDYATERARAMGLQRLFVLTTRTADWFRERGFVEVGVDQLPTRKRELYNFQRRSKVLARPI
jgi:amino-acid N-acetyltransferase